MQHLASTADDLVSNGTTSSESLSPDLVFPLLLYVSPSPPYRCSPPGRGDGASPRPRRSVSGDGYDPDWPSRGC